MTEPGAGFIETSAKPEGADVGKPAAPEWPAILLAKDDKSPTGVLEGLLSVN